MPTVTSPLQQADTWLGGEMLPRREPAFIMSSWACWGFYIVRGGGGDRFGRGWRGAWVWFACCAGVAYVLLEWEGGGGNLVESF